MPRLRLLGGQTETIRAVVIEPEEVAREIAILRETARTFHNIWLNNGADPANKRLYAKSLLKYARAICDRDMERYALSLLAQQES